jgi:hypothetical protein
LLAGGAALGVVSVPDAGAAVPQILLRTSGPFAVLAGSGITNTGATTIAGDVGTFPTPTESGFDTVTLDGVNHGGDAVTQQAKDDLTKAYDQAAASGPARSVVTELGGRTLTPGVYRSDTLGITGTLTLDTLGDPRAVFVFQAASTLTTATDSAVIVLGGGEACNVFWQIGSSATLGTRTHLVGSVLAATSITATTGATVQGRLLALTGAVTLDHNTLTRATCSSPPTTTGPGPTTTAPVSGGSTGGVTIPTTGGTPGGTTVPVSSGQPGSTPVGPVPTTDLTGSGAPLPPTAPPAAATPPTTAPPGSGAPRLPFTGLNSGGLAAVALALLAIGGGTTVWAHRRHASLQA